MDAKRDLVRIMVGTTDGKESVVGKIFKEYEGGKCFDYTVSDIPHGLTSDCHIESPQFSFLNAKWIFKLRPCHRMENSQKASFDIVLQRLESQVPVHHVILEIVLYYPEGATKEKSISFNSRRIQSAALKFELKELDVPQLEFCVELKALNSTRIFLKPQKKSAEKSPADGIKAEPSNSPSESMVCLKYKAFQDYKRLFFKREHCDVTFKVKEQELHAHIIILDVRCPVLASAFRNETKEKITGVMEIEDCDPAHFSDFLYFIYCGELGTLSTENVFALYTFADKYDVQDLKTMCLDFIKRNLFIETFCETITLALLHCEIDLIKLCAEFFAKNMKQIIVTVKWQSFLLANPIQANELFIKALNINDGEVQ